MSMPVQHYEVILHPPGTQGAESASSFQPPCFQFHYPVSLADGSCLELPLRPLPGGNAAIALLMSNQTSFAVEQALADAMTELIRPLQPEMIVGVPTMGLDYARLTALRLGLPNYVALGLSRKFWYDDQWSESTVSSTSPGQAKSVYLDPYLLERVAGKRVVIVDDVINTGLTAAAALRLLLRAGARVAGLAMVLTEGQAWRSALEEVGAQWPQQVNALGHIPLFRRVDDGWAVQ